MISISPHETLNSYVPTASELKSTINLPVSSVIPCIVFIVTDVFVEKQNVFDDETNWTFALVESINDLLSVIKKAVTVNKISIRTSNPAKIIFFI